MEEINSEKVYLERASKGDNSVVVIGAGPSGILSTRYISAENNVLCVESKEEVGGMWHFDDYTEETH